MTPDIYTAKIENEYSQGEEKTFEHNGHREVVFIGTITLPYNQGTIVRHNEFRLRGADKNTSDVFDSFEKAVEAYFGCKSYNKVLFQKKTLFDGAEREDAVACNGNWRV